MGTGCIIGYKLISRKNEPDVNGWKSSIARTVEQQREPAEQKHNVGAIKVGIHMPTRRKKEQCTQAYYQRMLPDEKTLQKVLPDRSGMEISLLNSPSNGG